LSCTNKNNNIKYKTKKPNKSIDALYNKYYSKHITKEMHERIKREQEEEMKNIEAHIESEFAKNEKDPNYEIDLLGDNNEFHKKVLKEEEKNKKIASNYYQKAKRYAKNKKYAKALKFYEKALDMDLNLSLNQDEQSANFNNEISLLYYKLKKYTLAYSHQRDASELFLRFKRENFKYLSFDKKNLLLIKIDIIYKIYYLWRMLFNQNFQI